MEQWFIVRYLKYMNHIVRFSFSYWRKIKLVAKFHFRDCLHVNLHPGTEPPLSVVNCLLLFARFHRDEFLSWDELIRVKKTRIKFYPAMKKRKKVVQTLHSGMKYYNEHAFT